MARDSIENSHVHKLHSYVYNIYIFIYINRWCVLSTTAIVIIIIIIIIIIIVIIIIIGARFKIERKVPIIVVITRNASQTVSNSILNKITESLEQL